eukprot:TRINITY_DN8525_c0_g1_i1.p1 TRINITY_DN8525_c0_g1~~TRINITY_DN8525_c0_g1_i1.p1  ORF type:complete len:247 (+),score=47.75 TRINITY_DN8525_c0_g1_i1:252-992(+)
MKRRGLGMGYISKKQEADQSLANLGEKVEEERTENLEKRLEMFKKNLQQFAEQHGKRIKNDPVFRYHFSSMCSKMGVDPLSSGKGFFAKTLGIGDFYYELAMQASEICMLTRSINGGLLPLDDLTDRIKKRRPSQASQITSDDISYSIKKLDRLGSGFEIKSLPSGCRFVQSVPGVLSTDGLLVVGILNQLKEDGSLPAVTEAELGAKLSWSEERTHLAVSTMLKEGLLWIDEYDNRLWSPSVCGL